MSNNIQYDILDDFSSSKKSKLFAPKDKQTEDSPRTTVHFHDELMAYLSKNKPVVYILTPCFGSVCYVSYVHCLINTIDLFKRYNIELIIEFCRNDSLVSRARNNLIARAMTNPKMTHAMFIDNDITWNPSDILKLIMSDKNLIGGVYPLKNYNWEDLVKEKNKDTPNTNIINSLIQRKNNSQFKDIISDEDMVRFNVLRYNINYFTNNLNIDKNLAKVRHIATGFMMIKRDVIEKMSKAFPSTKYVDDVGFLKPNENEFAYALFDCGVEEGHYFSEDWLFCHRWSKMGGSIWIDVSIALTHTGIEDFKGCYIASLI